MLEQSYWHRVKKMQYSVAGLRFQVEGLCHFRPWASFESVLSPEAVVFSLRTQTVQTVNRDLSYFHLPDVAHFFSAQGSIVAASEDYTRFYTLRAEQGMEEVLLAYLFYTHAVRRQMIQLHCATIEDQGRGILFLGPSGIGKTTQAERWAEFRGSSIINGDVGFVQRTEREYIAWGTPWHGSSPYCLNTSVPVKALVVLKQAQENKLRELTGFEKVAEVSGSVFYPTWLEDGMDLCTDTLNHLLTDLPVYRLDNRADREAVELLARELDRIS